MKEIIFDERDYVDEQIYLQQLREEEMYKALEDIQKEQKRIFNPFWGPENLEKKRNYHRFANRKFNPFLAKQHE